jgi:hypothetical protein
VGGVVYDRVCVIQLGCDTGVGLTLTLTKEGHKTT